MKLIRRSIGLGMHDHAQSQAETSTGGEYSPAERRSHSDDTDWDDFDATGFLDLSRLNAASSYRPTGPLPSLHVKPNRRLCAPLDNTISTESNSNSYMFQHFQNVLSDFDTSSQSTVWPKQLHDGASMPSRRLPRQQTQPIRLRGLDETDDIEWDHLRAHFIDPSQKSHLTPWLTTSPHRTHSMPIRV